MTESESKALFKICAQLQKEINDLKKENDLLIAESIDINAWFKDQDLFDKCIQDAVESIILRIEDLEELTKKKEKSSISVLQDIISDISKKEEQTCLWCAKNHT